MAHLNSWTTRYGLLLNVIISFWSEMLFSILIILNVAICSFYYCINILAFDTCFHMEFHNIRKSIHIHIIYALKMFSSYSLESHILYKTSLENYIMPCHANIHKKRERENRERNFNPSLEKNANQIWFADANYKSMLIHTNY